MQFSIPAALCLWLLAAPAFSASADSTENPDISPLNSVNGETQEETPSYSASTLYALMVAEMAGQRQLFDVALGNYLLEAHRTQDPGVAARATQIAQYIGADQAALDAATLWSKLDEQNPKAHHAVSLELIKAQRFSEAALHLQSALSLDESLPVDFVSLQGTHLSPGSREQWINALTPALQLFPKHPSLLFNLASLYQQQKDIPRALSILEQVIELQEGFYPAWNLKARLHASNKELDLALETTNSALKEFEDDKAFVILKARLLIKKKEIKAARAIFKQLTEDYPADAHIWLPLALTQLELGELDAAEVSLRELLRQGKMTNEAHFYLGRIEQKNGNHDVALEHYLAMQGGREYLAAQNHILQIHVHKEQFEDALTHVQNQRTIDPDNSQAYFLMEVELLNRTKQFDKSMEVLNQALGAYADNTDLRYSRAMVSEKLGDLSQLEADLNYIIDKEPQNATALNALGYTLADRTPRLDEALQLIKQARNLQPEDPAIIDSLGWVYYRMGRLQEAVQLLREAFKLFPDPEVAAHLGEVLWQMGQKQEARDIWQQGLNKKPTSAIIKSTMERLIDEK